MAKVTRKESETSPSPKEIQEYRKRYYEAMRQGHDKYEAGRIASDGGDVAPKYVAHSQTPAHQPPKKLARDPEPMPESKPEEVSEPEDDVFEDDLEQIASDDDLTKIRGIGLGTVKKLSGLGISRYAQMARWNKEEAQRIDDQLTLRGQIARENWVDQAKKLAGL